ncbi:MAG: hypothetical protein IPG77_07980 [Betaproteobacteria bacterium]|nr:hypothetical protein [Betaproteobacteria bacterium]
MEDKAVTRSSFTALRAGGSALTATGTHHQRKPKRRLIQCGAGALDPPAHRPYLDRSTSTGPELLRRYHQQPRRLGPTAGNIRSVERLRLASTSASTASAAKHF